MDSSINLEKPIKECSYLSLYITIEPQLLVPEAYRESVGVKLLPHKLIGIRY